MSLINTFKQSVGYQSRFSQEPLLDHQLHAINDTYLDIKGYAAESHLAMGWIGIWVTIMFLLPIVVYLDFSLVSTIFIDFNKINWDEANYLPLILILFANIVFLLMGLGWSFWNIKDLQKTSLIRFNRQTQKIHAIIAGHYCEADWQSIKAEFATQRIPYGYVVETRDVIRLLLKSEEKPDKELAAIIEATDSMDNDYEGCKMAWEYIRHFMFHGPEQLPVYAAQELERAGQFQQCSYPPKEAFKNRWFWPIIPGYANEDKKWVYVSMWPFKVLLFIPNLLTDIIWHWALNKFGGCFAKLPEDLTSSSDQGSLITPQQLNTLLQKNEQYLTYSTAKERLITQL